MKSLNEIMGDLRSGFAGLSEAEKTNMAATIGGQEAMSGLLAIVNASDGDFRKLQTSIYSCDGAAKGMAETMQNNLKGSLTILGSAAEGFGIKVYEKMQVPLRKAVDAGTEGVNRLSKAFDSGGLKGVVSEAGKLFREFADEAEGSSKSAGKIVPPLRNIASAGLNLGKAVLPLVVRTFKLLAENLDVVVPLLAAGVAAVKAYAVAASVAGAVKKLSAAYAAFSAVVTANPVGLAVAAVAALAAGLVTYSVIADDAKDKSYELSDSERKLVDSCNELTDSLNSQRAAREKSVQAIDMEYDGYQSLLSELQSITDENGRVKAGYEERARVITGELSDALGTEIALTDGVIQNYQETAAALDEVIAKKKAEALCSALQEEMAVAYKNSQEALLAYKDAMTVAEERERALADAQEKWNAATAEWERNLSPKAHGAMKEAEQAVKEAQTAFDEASEAVDGARTSLNELAAEVNNYDALVEAMQSGTVEEIESAMNSLVSGYQEYTKEMLASSQTARDEMISHAQETTGALAVLVEEGGQMYRAYGEDAADAAAKAVSEFQKLPGGIKAAVNEIGTDGAAAMVAALAQADFDGKLSEESMASYEAFLSGLANLPEGTRQALSDAVEGAMIGMDGFDQISKRAEEEGISFLDALRAALDEHSPSKATEEIFRLAMEGAALGVDAGKEGVLSRAGEFIAAFLGVFTESDLGTTLQNMGSRFMSFFGIGLSSQQGASRNAGKVNADAANAGAGSVNPNATGSRFGMMLGTGVAGMAGALFQKGKGIADRAKSGAGTVNPTDTGGRFGSQYASGVGSKAGEANAKGRALASNADSGAGSKTGYNSGSNFGAGFVSGIGSWLGRAASAAANLAMSAYNALRGALAERSPSRKAKKSGKNFDLGFGIGIEENAKAAVDSARGMAEGVLDAIDVDALSEKMKSMDVPDLIARMDLAVEDRQSRVVDKVVGAVIAKEKSGLVDEGRGGKLEIDYKRLGRELSKRPVIVSVEMDKRVFVRATAAEMERQIEENVFLKEMLKGKR